MPTNVIDRAKEVFGAESDLSSFFDPTVVQTLGLTTPERRVIAAILLGERVFETVFRRELDAVVADSGFKARAAYTVLEGLNEAGLLSESTLEGSSTTDYNLSGLFDKLRVQEDDYERRTGEPPTKAITFKPLKQVVLEIARAGTNQIQALANVYAFCFGRGRVNYPLLGKIVAELGRDKAALFFLEHSVDTFQGDPLKELLPLALYIAKGRKPPEPDLPEPSRSDRIAERRDWIERLVRWLVMDKRLENIGVRRKGPTHWYERLADYTSSTTLGQLEADGRQYIKDMARLKKETLTEQERLRIWAATGDQVE